jgi:hypothetical protein
VAAVTGFLPWIVFWVVSSPSSWEWAALAALVTALIQAVPDVEKRSPKLLDVATIAFFAVLTVLGVILDRSDLDWLEDNANAISSAVLALIAFGSLAFTPFTEQYARDSTPPEVWSSPTFKHVNRVLTAMWGGVFLLTTILGVIADVADPDDDWLEWVIPIALIVGAIKFTAWYPNQVRGEQPRTAA